MRPLKTLLALLMLFLTAQGFAAGARRGWTKRELSHADGRNGPIPSALLTKFGAELIGDYGAYTVIYVPKGMVTALEAQARTENIRVRGRDELDVLHLPGAVVDVREGISGVPADKLIREYPPGRPGVYVLQFIGPLRNEWAAQLRDLGWTLSRYMPNNAYLVAGTPELVGRTRQLPFVNWLDFYHPYQKAKVLKGDGQSHDLLFELAEGAASESGIASIRAMAEGEVDVQRNSYDTRVHARMSEAAAEVLLRNEAILSVSPRPVGWFSDERRSLSLTSHVNPAQTAPELAGRGQYWTWVTSRCEECFNMPHSIWKIGIADSGLDNGQSLNGHQDLNARKYFGNALYGPYAHDPQCGTNVVCDAYGHGTIVAGIAAGRPITGDVNGPFKDGGGFRLGQGVAEGAGVFATKIFSFDSAKPQNDNGINPSRLFLWATDAANAGVVIQNHSWNEYSFGHPGWYSTVSRDYDIATRDADGVVNFSRVPMLFSISAGNHEFNDSNPLKYLTLPGATAKNVLSVGGLENYRPDAPALCQNTNGDSYRNMMRYGRAGTDIAGYVKPDLMAPASLIVSTNSSMLWADPPYCFDKFGGHPEYGGDSGTSWAAPVGAAASLIVKRYLGFNSPSDVSPALTRAVLIAGARSVRGGLDKRREFTPGGVVEIGPIPSQQQGFGRLTLEDILNGAQKPIVFDQAGGDRTFTAPGQSFTTVVRVRDASKPVKIALVWTDTPAAAFSTNPLINDLNLEVRRSSNPNIVYVGNSMYLTSNGEESQFHSPYSSLPYDNRNTVEVFRLFVNTGEELTVTVKAHAINGDTNEASWNFEQDFALAILNADSTCVPTFIAQHPQNQTVTPGSFATVSVVPGGDGPFLYQWYEGPTGTFNNPQCGGATPSCTVGPLTTTRQYWVRVRGACGDAVFSNAATITVQCTAPPSITAQPTNRTIDYNGSTTLSVSATQAVSYQWYRGTWPSTATPVGTNSPTLAVSGLTSTTNYWVRVFNGCGTADSVTATVCVRPSITAHPTSRTINPGQSTTLTVSAVNATSYQWYQGTAPSTTTPVGPNSSSLTVSPTVTTSYWVRVFNGCSSVDSTTATVTVAPPPPPQITRIQTSFALANSQTSITASWPQPTQPGTLLVAVISGRKDPNGSIVWGAPAGWVHASTQEWTNIIASVYYIPNNAGARTSERFTVAAGFHDMTLYLLEYSGIVAVNPLDKIAGAGNDTNDGYVESGYTATTSQAKELVITALTTYTPTEFYSPSNGFIEIYDKFIGNRLTTAVHERITTAQGMWGHYASVASPGYQWVGLVVTFRGAS